MSPPPSASSSPSRSPIVPLRFRLIHDDATVATGVAFGWPTAQAVVAWIDGRSIEVFEDIEAVERAHRPEGREIEWIDAPGPSDSPDSADLSP
jgi:hypothetical protein